MQFNDKIYNCLKNKVNVRREQKVGKIELDATKTGRITNIIVISQLIFN